MGGPLFHLHLLSFTTVASEDEDREGEIGKHKWGKVVYNCPECRKTC